MLRGSTLVRRHLETSFAMSDRKFGSRWRVQKVAAHQSRAEVDSVRLSHHEWFGKSKAALYTCSSGEWFSVAKSAEDVKFRDVAPVARARLQVTFHEIAWALDRWRCSRCQRYATACVPPFGAARGATTTLPRVHLSDNVRRSWPITWCTMCGAYSSNRSFALRQSCPGSCPSDTRSQRLRQLVVDRHPITGAWLLGATQPL